MNVAWAIFKSFIESRGLSIQWLDVEGQYHLWAYDGPFGLTCQIPIAVGEAEPSADQVDFEDNFKLIGNASPKTTIKNVNETPDYRGIMAVNRIPAGYTIYPTGAGDHIGNNTYGNGEDCVLEDGALTKSFQFLHHFYAIGGRATWEGADLTSKVNAWLYAPASTGWTEAAGDYNKFNVGGPYNMLIPAAPGAGAWNVDLAAKLGATTVLASTPVPAAGNNGFFDYDSDTNVLTVNAQQQGGYNLYDFDINLFKFCNQIPGRKGDGSESTYEATDVIGKLLYNAWKIKFTLTPGTPGTTAKCGIIMITAAKKNL